MLEQPKAKLPGNLTLKPQNNNQIIQSNGTPAQITIAATFTAEPIADYLSFWLEELNLPFAIEFAPYNQVFQQLLDPSSQLARNQQGINVILVNFEDWQKYDNTPGNAEEKISRNLHDLLNALKAAVQRSTIPHLLCLCPPAPEVSQDPHRAEFWQAQEELIVKELAEINGIYVTTSKELQTTYAVVNYYDPQSNELGHIPYTSAGFAALGTLVARKISALKRSPYKVIVLDCDQTLWKGVCGEVGAQGITIDPPRQHLQEMLIAQQEAGMLLCLCSKNIEDDVMVVFEQRQDMPLKLHHLVNWRINWQPKSANLQSLAEELQLGIDSFIFIDDNPVECAEVRANCPEVLTLQLPQQPQAIERFLNHTWAFDHLKTTKEDRKRTQLYQQNVQRERWRHEALTFDDFLSGLGLEVEINSPTAEQMPRLAQLTQRTNQFNMTTIRRSEGEVKQILEAGELAARVVEVKDRFGDYGLVGVLLFGQEDDKLKVDSFMLSCRVLGRGVEHQMLAELGKIAQERGLSYVDVPLITTKKNQPALNFLVSLGTDYQQKTDSGWLFSFPTSTAAQLTYNPQNGAQANQKQAQVKKTNTNSNQPLRSPSELFERIATELYEPEQVLSAVKSKQRRELEQHSFVAPRNELEKRLIAIWEEVLGVYPVGVQDNFFDIGGTSVIAVRLFTEIEKTWHKKLPLATIFQAATVEQLALKLAQQQETTDWASLVAIKPDGTQPPLFCVHGAGGNVLVFRDLARNLPAAQPFYGLQSLGMDGKQRPLKKISRMASRYLQEIRSVQPQGPYYLAGYCLGSQIAFAMAQMLRDAGEEVALLALLEPSEIKISPTKSSIQKQRTWRDRIADLQYRLVTMGLGYLLRQQSLKLVTKVYRLLDISLPLAMQIIQVEEANIQASRQYGASKPYPGHAVMFVTKEQMERFEQFHRGWQDVVTGDLQVCEVPGKHEDTLEDSFLKEPYVQVLAKELSNRMEQVS